MPHGSLMLATLPQNEKPGRTSVAISAPFARSDSTVSSIPSTSRHNGRPVVPAGLPP